MTTTVAFTTELGDPKYVLVSSQIYNYNIEDNFYN